MKIVEKQYSKEEIIQKIEEMKDEVEGYSRKILKAFERIKKIKPNKNLKFKEQII